MPRAAEALTIYETADAPRRFYRGYGNGFNGGAVGSIPTANGMITPDTRSPSGEPSSFQVRQLRGLGEPTRYAGYFGDNAFRDGESAISAEGAASVTGAVAAGEGITIWKSVGAGVLVWALTRAIDRFVFGGK